MSPVISPVANLPFEMGRTIPCQANSCGVLAERLALKMDVIGLLARADFEISAKQRVMNGDLDVFIEASLKQGV